MSLGVRLSRYHAVCVRRISLGGEGNALYPVLFSFVSVFQSLSLFVSSLKRLKPDIALHGNSSQSYGASLAIRDHTVLPATRHK